MEDFLFIPAHPLTIAMCERRASAAELLDAYLTIVLIGNQTMAIFAVAGPVDTMFFHIDNAQKRA